MRRSQDQARARDIPAAARDSWSAGHR